MRRGILVSLLALLCGSAARAGQPIVVVDAAHHEVSFAHPPQRIASLLPSLTETVCELEECARLVVVDRYSDWPESVTRLPKAGGLEDIDIEQIVSVHPDVVLLAHEPRIRERLDALGLIVVEFTTDTYSDIAHNVSVIAALLNVPERARRVNRQIQQSMEEIATATRTALEGRAPRVYYEVDPVPYGAGPQSFIGQMLGRTGAHNILSTDLGPFPKLNPEYVVRANPDVIFVSPIDAPYLAERPGWRQIRAIREGRICAFAPAVRDTIVRPGPRIAQGFKALTDCLRRMAP
jgi:iron complex transport system substrate-binding protein